MADSGFVIDLETGVEVVKEGMAERELYVILEGACEVIVDGKRVAIRETGDVLGEIAFFREAGRRTATVRALRKSRILIVRYRFLEEIKHKDPALAFDILMHLGDHLSGKLVEATNLLAASGG